MKTQLMHGRKVTIRRIDRLSYLSPYVNEKGREIQWFLVTEKDGTTWIYDGFTEEG